MRRGRGRQRARLVRRASQAHHFLRPRPISPTLHLPCHLRTTRWRCGPAYSYLLPAGVRRVQAEPCPSHQGRRRRAWSCQRCEWKSPSLTQQQWVQPQHAGRQAGLSQSYQTLNACRRPPPRGVPEACLAMLGAGAAKKLRAPLVVTRGLLAGATMRTRTGAEQAHLAERDIERVEPALRSRLGAPRSARRRELVVNSCAEAFMRPRRSNVLVQGGQRAANLRRASSTQLPLTAQPGLHTLQDHGFPFSNRSERRCMQERSKQGPSLSRSRRQMRHVRGRAGPAPCRSPDTTAAARRAARCQGRCTCSTAALPCPHLDAYGSCQMSMQARCCRLWSYVQLLHSRRRPRLADLSDAL